LTVPSVERRNRRAPIEKARNGRDWTGMWTMAVVLGVWSLVFASFDPPNLRTRVALCAAAAIIALAFALAARRIEPEQRRDSPRWHLLAGFAIGWRGVLVGVAVFIAVLSVLGKFPEHARAAAAVRADGAESDRELGRAD
jgi:uncharacterized membrane protein YfcA